MHASGTSCAEAYTQELARVHAAMREALATQQQLQDALRQQTKLAAMSSIVASMAHELNNLLAALVLHVDLLHEHLSSSPLAAQTQVLTHTTQRCIHLVRTLLSLVRLTPPQRTSVALNTIVHEAILLLSYALQADGITVHQHLTDAIPPVWADPHEILQVVLNLLTNAHQALRETAGSRHITLSTQLHSDRSRCVLEVIDTGPGIPPELQAQIFEPFFTTKPHGVGTGLGLSLCQEIISAHDGTLTMQSTPGHGAAFRVEIPLKPDSAVISTPMDTAALPAISAKTILVIDDDVCAVRALRHLLRRDGHTVETAANGRLGLAKLHVCDYDLILCDMRMPELDGPGFYRELECSAPHLCPRVLFLTGDILAPEMTPFFQQVTAPYLMKPFNATELRHAIRHAVQAAGR
jgi:nitrogen-specific signal transduction histidine kinase/ActR/RegA family two-component response regulator